MKKIAVMLPHGYRGGSLRGAKNIAKSIAFAAHEKEQEVQIVFSYVENGPYDLYKDFNDLKEYGISLRPTIWKIFPRSLVAAGAAVMDIKVEELTSETYCLPTDGANDFFDCDLWIIISDRLPAPIFPVKKYISVIYDYIQRYAPAIWNDPLIWEQQEQILFPVARNAELVLVTTPSTQADLIAYAGVSKRRAVLIEMDFEPVVYHSPDHKGGRKHRKPSELIPSNDYFIWPTNLSFHKNHLNALKALGIYYQELGGSLDVVLTGYGSEVFDPERKVESIPEYESLPYVQLGRDYLENTFSLKDRIHFLGNTSDAIYAQLIHGAKFLLHPTLYDNGTFSVIEAAYFKKPSVSARYPAMEFINEKFGLNLCFFDPHNVHEMADSIFWMEQNHRKVKMPGRPILLKRSWKSFAPQLFQSISKIL